MVLDDKTTDERPGRLARLDTAPTTSERYAIQGALGHGGMGEVLWARDEQLGRDVAIKRIKASHPSERAIRRFLREAHVQGRLDHPAIPPVHELGRDSEGLPYFVMKKLTGTTLASILESRDPAFPRQRLLRALAEVCLAVEFAHVHGVVHRDLKPTNIMLGEFGEVYVLDWGVAKISGENDELDDLVAESPNITMPGAVVGTPSFMAPEQAAGAEIDARADVYALGRVLQEILRDTTGDPPPELAELQARATEAKLDQRIATARELGEAIQRFLDGDRDLELRRTLARTHLARAQAAFDRGDIDSRAEAMREAGRAATFDPELRAAAGLVGRLLLEPPRETPPEVEATIQREAVQRMRVGWGVARWSFAGYVVLIPTMWVGASMGEWLLLLTMLVANVVFGSLVVRTPFAPRAWSYALLGGLLLAVLSSLYTPLMTPGIAALMATRATLAPFVERVRTTVFVVSAFILGAMSPILLDHLGWIDPLFTVSDQGVLLHAVGLNSDAMVIAFAISVGVGLVAITTILAFRVREAQRVAARQLHLYTWHLRQFMA